MRMAAILSITLIAVVVSCSGVFADDLFAVEVAPGASATDWNYTLFNNDPSGKLRAVALILFWDDQESEGPNVSITDAPDVGYWISVTDSPVEGGSSTYVMWVNYDETEEPPLPGESLSGFGISSSAYMPTFIVTYYNTDDPTSWIDTDYGAVSLVPEPASLAGLAAGICCVGAILRRRNRR